MRPDVVDDFFVFGYVPSPRTMIDGIEQLPPAHVLEHDVATGREQLRRYWRPPRSRATNKEALQELDAETLRLVDQAVRRTLVSDVPLGVLLSGGVDSTLIAAIASGIGPAPLRTFTVGYDLGTVSELATARRTADLLGTHHEELMLTAADVARRVPRLLSVLDQPLADMALVPLHAIAEAARGSVKVVIGGQGADELFGGYPRYRWLQRSTRMHDVVPRKALRLGGRVAVGLRDHRLAHGEVGRVGRLADVLEPMPQLERHLDWVTSYRRHMRPALYGPALTALSSSAGAVASLTHHIAPDMLEQPSVGELMALDQGHWLPDDVLVMADRAGMLASLELRSPYLDRQLAEFAMTIDPSVHLGGGGKRLLRSALAQLAPGELARRRKRAFRTPAAEWLRGPLRQTMTDLVQEGRITRDGWFDRQELQRMMNAHANGIDLSGTLWPVLALGCWLEDAP
jgi:asparagine synthase (glutamine-hydrolysing)